jgi:hypothetical protein
MAPIFVLILQLMLLKAVNLCCWEIIQGQPGIIVSARATSTHDSYHAHTTLTLAQLNHITKLNSAGIPL